MKLQYLGDSRDSFKWDLLHYLAVNAGFRRLCIVPFLTPDDPSVNHGQTVPESFPCRKEILRLMELLRKSRNLSLVSKLGHLDHKHWFSVEVYHPDEYVLEGNDRYKYLAGLRPGCLNHTLLFFDPDIGFETKTQKGARWVRHQEVREVLALLPEDSAIVVYQHRPHRSWDDLFLELRRDCKYAFPLFAVHETSLAFLVLARNQETKARLKTSAESYVAKRKVKHSSLDVWDG